MPNTYVALRTETVAVATNSVTFDLTGISGYTDLKIIASVRSTRSALSDTFYMRLNGDTGSNYSWTFMRGDGSSATSFRAANVVGLGIGEVIAANQTAGIFNLIKIDLMNYSNTTTNKTSISRSDVAANYGAEAWVSMWRNTAAVTSMTLFMANGSNIEVGSTFSLYGIANADQGAAKATGGMITEDSQYWYHTFAASGAFIPKQSLTCDVLVVAGGGGGASDQGGAGGAGGYRYQTNQVLTPNSYSLVIGGGGSGGAGGATNQGTAGIASTGFTLTAGGGGAGAAPFGAGGAVGTGDSAAFTGGAGGNPQGGGGGAGGFGNGGDKSAAGGGAGGAGVTFFSTSVSGGGGGGNYGLLTSGIGASTFGGGNGGRNGNNAVAGTPNTGGGGGGGGWNGTPFAGANGGSGIVIVRYAK